jgi:hypothetical protein
VDTRLTVSSLPNLTVSDELRAIRNVCEVVVESGSGGKAR